MVGKWLVTMNHVQNGIRENLNHWQTPFGINRAIFLSTFQKPSSVCFCLGVTQGLHCRKRALHLLVRDSLAVARGLCHLQQVGSVVVVP